MRVASRRFLVSRLLPGDYVAAQMLGTTLPVPLPLRFAGEGRRRYLRFPPTHSPSPPPGRRRLPYGRAACLVGSPTLDKQAKPVKGRPDSGRIAPLHLPREASAALRAAACLVGSPALD